MFVCVFACECFFVCVFSFVCLCECMYVCMGVFYFRAWMRHRGVKEEGNLERKGLG